jgi:hypothetical protein
MRDYRATFPLCPIVATVVSQFEICGQIIQPQTTSKAAQSITGAQ